MNASAKGSGLDGVVVADTVLSEVDGEAGRLVVAGYPVERIAGAISFEEICALLGNGSLPTPEAAAAISKELGAARVAAFARIEALGDALSAADGMDALRASVAHLAESSAGRPEILLTAAVAVYAAAWFRVSQGKAPVAPDASLGHAADYLRMARGEPASAAAARGLDAYLVTVADHGMNASTFTARVIASTGSDMVSAVVGAIGALKGPLHGGAPGPVLDMLDAIAEPARAEAWIASELAAGRRIMGMGHRIYRVRDPRAAVLERALGVLEKDGGAVGRSGLARAVERVAEGALSAKYPDRPLRANVEFYTAVLLDAVGLDRVLFSPTFAASRVAGWCAHVNEQRKTGRLIRPGSRYIGPLVA